MIESVDSTHPGFTANRLPVAIGDTITGRIVIDRAAPDSATGDSSIGIYRNYAAGSSSIYDPETQTYQQPDRLHQSAVSLDLPTGEALFGAVATSGARGTLVYDPYADVSAPRVTVSDGTSHTSSSGAFGTSTGDSLAFYQVISEARPFGGWPTVKSRQTVELLFHDSSGTALSSDALPGSLDLSDVGLSRIFYQLEVPPYTIQTPVSHLYSGTVSFQARLVNLTVVPEPSASALFALAGISAALRRRRSAARAD